MLHEPVKLQVYVTSTSSNNLVLAGPDGLTHAAIGWAIWRFEEFLSRELVSNVGHCGSTPMIFFTINFSKTAIQIIAQYYQFLQLGE